MNIFFNLYSPLKLFISKVSEEKIHDDRYPFDDFEYLVSKARVNNLLDLNKFPKISEIKISYMYEKNASPVAGTWIEGFEVIYVTDENEYIPT